MTVLARPHWVNGWFLRSTARPYLCLNGVEHALTWGRARSFPATPGVHLIQTFWRYRGIRSALGRGTLRLEVQEGDTVFVLAQNGPLNNQPLQPRRC